MPPAHHPRAAERVLVVGLSGVGLAVTLVAIVAWLAPAAFGDRPASCLDTRCFCEAIGTGLLRQPANALSSLAFCVGAGWVAARAGDLPRHTVERRLAPVLVATLLALGAGSLAYHATFSYVGQWLDLQGMYLVGVLLVVGARWRTGRSTPARSAALAGALLTVLAVVQALAPDSRRWLFAAVLLPGIVLEHRVGPGSRPLRWAVAVLAVAWAAWWLDRGPWCDPASWLQWHAVWHVLTAVSATLLLAHYRVTARSAPARAAGGTRGNE